MEKTKMKSYSLSEMIDKHVGKRGTKAREDFEYKLNMALLSNMIKKARQERNLTQAQLGELVGVQKAQISKLENNANNASIETILKIFKALQAEIYFSVTIGGKQLSLT
ncbi:helix-turn-helix transcriptional regulator [Asinibacterium sp. OR53]|uniref:helix-turn-helix transcriptional regulator n=1 Tax=Asinibacterium sp. OR53 TaxID=925409 RepID=UPI00047B5FDC|nr:helix-turn-helix transcriptional regulator [Asinibacterium sp. OR53]